MARPKLGDLLTTVDTTTEAPALTAVAEPTQTTPAPFTTAQGAADADAPQSARPRLPEEPPTGTPGTVSTLPAAAHAVRSRAPIAGTDDDNATGPRYLELIRKEARFTDDQLDQLNTLTRRLNKARRGRGERLTDNTLIRVAVDMLLAKQGRLAGHTEEALRKSVGL